MRKDQSEDQTLVEEAIEKSKIFPYRRVFTVVALLLVFLLIIASIDDLFDAQSGKFNPFFFVILTLLSLFAQYVASSIGEGFGMLLVPTLILVGFKPNHVIPSVLLAETLNSIIGTISNQGFKKIDLSTRKLNLKMVMFLSIGGILLTFPAVIVSYHTPAYYHKILIASIYIIIGVITFLIPKLQWNLTWPLSILLGGIGSFSKVFSGGGYGALSTGGQRVMGVNPRRSTTITVFAKGITCILGFIGYYIILGSEIIHWLIILPMLIGVAIASPLSAWTLDRVDHEKIRDTIALIALILGCTLLAFILT